jgi:hypothetical protein
MESKPRMVEVKGKELQALALAWKTDLSVPVLYLNLRDSHPYCDAEELRAWRASQHSSGEQP